MKRKNKLWTFLTVLLLAAAFCGCAADVSDHGEPDSIDESAAASSETGAGDSSAVSSESSEDTPARDSLTDEELQRLDAYLTALEDENEDALITSGQVKRKTEPVFLGTVGEYTLCEWGYHDTAVDATMEERDYSYFPEFASLYGVYVIGAEDVWQLEDALESFLTIDDVYDMLTPIAKHRIDNLNQ